VDHSLTTAANQNAGAPFVVRTKAIGGAPIRAVEVWLDHGGWQAMSRGSDDIGRWQGQYNTRAAHIAVRARDTKRRPNVGLFLVALAILPVRGVLFSFTTSPYGVVAIQLLDGVAAGIFGVISVLIASSRCEAPAGSVWPAD
jgi:hypothetical protein